MSGAPGSTHYLYDDNLGTARMIVNSNGITCYDADFFPWGDEQHVYGNSCPQNYKFNDKERDPDMGVYDFGARFYQDAMARFYQPDWSASPEPVPYAKLNNPQSLNLYAYTVDNPLSLRDPNGHLWNASAVMDSSEEVPGAPGCEGGGVQPCELAEGQQQQTQQAQQNGYQQPNAANPAEVTLTNVTYDSGSLVWPSSGS
jgi:RHS repeat-associated protein